MRLHPCNWVWSRARFSTEPIYISSFYPRMKMQLSSSHIRSNALQLSCTSYLMQDLAFFFKLAVATRQLLVNQLQTQCPKVCLRFQLPRTDIWTRYPSEASRGESNIIGCDLQLTETGVIASLWPRHKGQNKSPLLQVERADWKVLVNLSKECRGVWSVISGWAPAIWE